MAARARPATPRAGAAAGAARPPTTPMARPRTRARRTTRQTGAPAAAGARGAAGPAQAGTSRKRTGPDPASPRRTSRVGRGSRGGDDRRGRSSDRSSNGRSSDRSRGRTADRASGGRIVRVDPVERGAAPRGAGRSSSRSPRRPSRPRGRRVSTDLSLAGRFLVLVPGGRLRGRLEEDRERQGAPPPADAGDQPQARPVRRHRPDGRRGARRQEPRHRPPPARREVAQDRAEARTRTPSRPSCSTRTSTWSRRSSATCSRRTTTGSWSTTPRCSRTSRPTSRPSPRQMADKVELHQGRGPVFRSLGIEKQVEEAFSQARQHARRGLPLYRDHRGHARRRRQLGPRRARQVAEAEPDRRQRRGGPGGRQAAPPARPRRHHRGRLYRPHATTATGRR